jgi:hypothetical protein
MRFYHRNIGGTYGQHSRLVSAHFAASRLKCCILGDEPKKRKYTITRFLARLHQQCFINESIHLTMAMSALLLIPAVFRSNLPVLPVGPPARLIGMLAGTLPIFLNELGYNPREEHCHAVENVQQRPIADA